MSYSEQDTPSPFRRAQVIWAAMAASILIYVILAGLMHIYEAPFHGFVELAPEIQQLLRAVFILAGISVIPVTPWLLEHAEPMEAQPPIVTRTVMAVAFADLPAILGLLFYLLTAGLPEFIGGLGLSAVLMAYYFPRPGGPTDLD